jgi:hypothetical protein
MSVKDRWVDPREQVLNVPITCQRYGSGKPTSLPLTEGGFTPTASMVVLGEKLGMNCRSVRQRVVDCVGSPFSR